MVSKLTKEEIKELAKQRLMEQQKKDKEKVDAEFERIKKLMDERPNGYYDAYVLRQLHEKQTLRKTLLAVGKESPALISEVLERALITRPTCYTQLFKLMELCLVDRIFIMDVVSGKIKNNDVLEKFDKWTGQMPDKLKRYYLAKASYWVITDLGKSFISKSWKFEQEFRTKEMGGDEYE